METEVVAFSNAVAAETTFLLEEDDDDDENVRTSRERERVFFVVVLVVHHRRHHFRIFARRCKRRHSCPEPPSFVVAFSPAFPDFYFDEAKDEW